MQLTIHLPWPARWQAVVEATYIAERGFETWWRAAVRAHVADPEHHPDPGYPLDIDEVEADYPDGDGPRMCRTFSGAGLIEWIRGYPRITGWPDE